MSQEENAGRVSIPLQRELEPDAVVIAKEYLDAMRSGKILPYNPEYVLMRLMVDLHGYVPPEPIAVQVPYGFISLANNSE
jgi:hypothetical protein